MYYKLMRILNDSYEIVKYWDFSTCNYSYLRGAQWDTVRRAVSQKYSRKWGQSTLPPNQV